MATPPPKHPNDPIQRRSGREAVPRITPGSLGNGDLLVKVGLVLGAGGVLGGAWLTGGLEAIARHTGWDPGSADRIVGTSAGAMIGAFTAAGVPPWFMVAHSAGETLRRARPAPTGAPRPTPTAPAARCSASTAGLPRLGPGLAAHGGHDPQAPARAHARSSWSPAGCRPG